MGKHTRGSQAGSATAKKISAAGGIGNELISAAVRAREPSTSSPSGSTIGAGGLPLSASDESSAESLRGRAVD